MTEDKAPSSADLRLALARLINALPDEDIPVVRAMVEQLPGAKLVATLEAETDKGIEDWGKKLVMPPTPRIVQAQCALLGAWDAWLLVLGRPRKLRGVDIALHRARTGQP